MSCSFLNQIIGAACSLVLGVSATAGLLAGLSGCVSSRTHNLAVSEYRAHVEAERVKTQAAMRVADEETRDALTARDQAFAARDQAMAAHEQDKQAVDKAQKRLERVESFANAFAPDTSQIVFSDPPLERRNQWNTPSMRAWLSKPSSGSPWTENEDDYVYILRGAILEPKVRLIKKGEAEISVTLYTPVTERALKSNYSSCRPDRWCAWGPMFDSASLRQDGTWETRIALKLSKRGLGEKWVIICVALWEGGLETDRRCVLLE